MAINPLNLIPARRGQLLLGVASLMETSSKLLGNTMTGAYGVSGGKSLLLASSLSGIGTSVADDREFEGYMRVVSDSCMEVLMNDPDIGNPNYFDRVPGQGYTFYTIHGQTLYGGGYIERYYAQRTEMHGPDGYLIYAAKSFSPSQRRVEYDQYNIMTSPLPTNAVAAGNAGLRHRGTKTIAVVCNAVPAGGGLCNVPAQYLGASCHEPEISFDASGYIAANPVTATAQLRTATWDINGIEQPIFKTTGYVTLQNAINIVGFNDFVGEIRITGKWTPNDAIAGTDVHMLSVITDAAFDHLELKFKLLPPAALNFVLNSVIPSVEVFLNRIANDYNNGAALGIVIDPQILARPHVLLQEISAVVLLPAWQARGRQVMAKWFYFLYVMILIACRGEYYRTR